MSLVNPNPKKFRSKLLKQSILQLLKEIPNQPYFNYPWQGLEEYLIASGHNMKFIGYGSLINKSSAEYTLDSRALKTFVPATAFGVKRIFNYIMPDHIERYDKIENDVDKAALNVQFTGRVNDLVNGVAMELSSADIQAMRERELGYDLIPVPCIQWNHFNDKPFTVYILRCEDLTGEGSEYTSDAILPHKQYYDVCRKGAQEISKEFLDVWLNNTFLADGKTSVSKWEIKPIKK